MGHKCYGSIPHMIGSRRAEGDHLCNAGMQRICTLKARDAKDRIVVLEKLDGSNCGVFKDLQGNIHAITRSGYLATSSPFEQHHLFAVYVREQAAYFDKALRRGERIVGEWLAQAHGTRYDLREHAEPYVPFDLMVKTKRFTIAELSDRLTDTPWVVAPVLHSGGPLPLLGALSILGENGFYGAVEHAEGVVYRVERGDEVDFLAKYVYPEKVDGAYLPEVSGGDPVWNWRPRKYLLWH